MEGDIVEGDIVCRWAILNTRLRKVSEEAKLLPEEQQGFREGREPGDNVFVLMTLLEKSKYMKKPLHMSFIDITKAYDSVCRKRLWFKMSQMNFPPKFINILKHMYKDDSIETEMGCIKTSKVYPRRGLRQGCNMSPLLFDIYISELSNRLSSLKIGVQLWDLKISHLGAVF